MHRETGGIRVRVADRGCPVPSAIVSISTEELKGMSTISDVTGLAKMTAEQGDYNLHVRLAGAVGLTHIWWTRPAARSRNSTTRSLGCVLTYSADDKALKRSQKEMERHSITIGTETLSLGCEGFTYGGGFDLNLHHESVG